MTDRNSTSVTEFILQGFTGHPKGQISLFLIFLIIYLFTLLGNLGMVALIRQSPLLHSPMYFFLTHFSLMDACITSTIAPPMLLNFLLERKAISYSGCILQFFMFCAFTDVEAFILVIMAYDRYVAICRPLSYTAIMSKPLCMWLLTGAYIGGVVNSLIHTCASLRLSYCGKNSVNHFFCDLAALMALACSDTSLNELLLLTFGTFVEAFNIVAIITSYAFIITAIVRMHSTEGRLKAFSTCASHLTTFALFHGTILYMYFRPTSSFSMDTDKGVSLFYTLIIPMLNPLIYSLRNKEVQDALRKLIGKNLHTH
ncbi:olfactory receptor-like protein OLF1 [Hemicordylus capensis]|uniref:olfactory receptor-like protein OLF1 n=1 Tax=Hemicordylus capensis TaxID=884348 RepID=UPI002303AE3F|nr:olfactory receptor-like protein OLF1 [Hemicordylus capensis]